MIYENKITFNERSRICKDFSFTALSISTVLYYESLAPLKKNSVKLKELCFIQNILKH